MLFSGADNPKSYHSPWKICAPFNTSFLEPTRLSLQTASRSVQPFLASTPLRSLPMNGFQWGRQPQKIALPLGIFAPHGSLSQSDSVPKRHLDRFCRFRRVHERDQQRDRQTDLATPSDSNSPLSLGNTAVQPKLFCI